MQDSSIRYQMLSIHLDRINITSHFEVKRKSSHTIVKDYDSIDFDNVVPVKKVVFSIDNKLSTHTQRKISQSIKYLNFLADSKTVLNNQGSKICKFKIAFITLTLASQQVHTDNQIKNQLLNQFFVELKKRFQVKHYVWRCEKQINGNVHFHILTDQFIPHDKLREIWNRIQNKLGYVDRYQDRMSKLTFKEYAEIFKNNKKYNRNQLLSMFKKGKANDWRYPNSTDVHSLQFINNIDSYLIKYMSKQDQNKDIEGRLWGASQSLSNIKGGRTIIDSDISGELSKLSNDPNCKWISGDYFNICYVDIMYLKYIGCHLLFELFKQFCIEKFITSNTC